MGHVSTPRIPFKPHPNPIPNPTFIPNPLLSSTRATTAPSNCRTEPQQQHLPKHLHRSPSEHNYKKARCVTHVVLFPGERRQQPRQRVVVAGGGAAARARLWNAQRREARALRDSVGEREAALGRGALPIGVGWVGAGGVELE